jgi:hypothetical protein
MPPDLWIDQDIEDLAPRRSHAAQPPEYFEVAADLIYLLPRLDARFAREFVVIQSRRASQGFNHTIGVRDHQGAP